MRRLKDSAPRHTVRAALLCCLLVGGQASHSAPPAGADPLAGIEELADFMATSLATQKTIHHLLDYCAGQMEGRSDDAAQAKALWNSRNVTIVGAGARRDVARAWFTAAGIPAESIDGLVTRTDTSITNAATQNRPEERAVAAVAAGGPEDRLRACSAFVSAVNRGTQDLRVVAPKAYTFYQKYAPRKP